jgi:predicted O-methyltransferase YrrM
MPDLAIIVPTRGRPGNVQRVISAWDFTNAWDHADLVLVADADDPEIQGYRDLVESTEHPDTGQPLVRLLEVPRWMPMVHKLDLAAREMAELYWAVGFAGDDHLPQTIGWAARYLAVLRELGTGMVYGDDGYQGAKLSTEWAITSDVVRALGRMVPAPVEHMFCDNAVLELFLAAGAVRHLPEVRIEHMHPYAGKATTDDQYQRVNSREQMSRDRRTFRAWQVATLASQVATVRALRAGQAEQRAAARRPVRTARRQGRIMMKPPRFFRRVRAATPEDVMIALADFAAQVPGDQEIVELGVFHGRTALQMAWGARQGGRAHVTAIDPWDLPGNTYDAPFTDPSARRWAHHHVKTLGYARDIRLIQAFSQDAAAEYDGPPVGLLFVDGDHSEEGARRDIELWAPHLAPGARIAVDDYGHPDWPGVKAAVDALVDEGVLEPVEVFHGALAVTRLATTPDSGRTTAVTSEGVHPSPEPADPFEHATGEPCSDPWCKDKDQPTGRELEMPWPEEGERTPQPDSEVSTVHAPNRTVVTEGELEGVAAGTAIGDLNTAQLRALAKVRGIVLGTRKDKKADMVAALEAGE